jgi:beta-lactamase superfamily II metal-dependent hydrolase
VEVGETVDGSQSGRVSCLRAASHAVHVPRANGPRHDADVPFIDNHVVRVVKDPKRGSSPQNTLTTLFWGDEVADLTTHRRGARIVLGPGRVGWALGPVRTRSDRLLHMTFIDVGQGDACLLESPSGKRVLIDGGEHQRLARYLSKRFVSPSDPNALVVFDAIVITHGDADHFDGLTILATDASEDTRAGKRIQFAAARLFHNGLVKRPASGKSGRRTATQMFGRTVRSSGRTFATDLVDRVDAVPAAEMNRPFRAWANAIRVMRKRHPLESKRLERGDDSEFAFFDPNIQIEVLGPTTTPLPGGRFGLPFLSAPGSSSPSAAHTINGHSVVLRLTYGNVRALLTADLNSAAEGALLAEAREGRLDLQAEVLKVPHHGSGDFASAFFHAIRPVVSIVSTGDEDERHEYIHPHANLMGALGKAGRTDQPIVFVTDLAAFDRYAGPALPARSLPGGGYAVKPGAPAFHARERVAHGVIHLRSDGRRLFVGTSSGRRDRTEHYLFDVDSFGAATRAEVDRV